VAWINTDVDIPAAKARWDELYNSDSVPISGLTVAEIRILANPPSPAAYKSLVAEKGDLIVKRLGYGNKLRFLAMDKFAPIDLQYLVYGFACSMPKSLWATVDGKFITAMSTEYPGWSITFPDAQRFYTFPPPGVVYPTDEVFAKTPPSPMRNPLDKGPYSMWHAAIQVDADGPVGGYIDPLYNVYVWPLALLRANGALLPIYIWNPKIGDWQWYRSYVNEDQIGRMVSRPFLLFPFEPEEDPTVIMVLDEALPLSPKDLAAVTAVISTSTLPLVVPTEYIVMGDEVPGKMILDFHAMLVQSGTPDADDLIKQLRELFSCMPRMMLRPWFDDNIRAQLEWNYVDAIWAATVELFNSANVEAATAASLQPWDYEQKKLDSYYESQNSAKVDQLKATMDSYAASFSDPRALDILNQYQTLPRLGDIGFEISRQAGIKALIQQGKYDEAQGIIEAFKYMDYTEYGDGFKKPLPVDVTMPDGTTFKAT
jgi:hypothetical protein